MIETTLQVNGRAVSRPLRPRQHLADMLREELNLTATHLGCEHGVCGACTLMLDGRPVRSCLTYAVACAGTDVWTLEGLDQDPVMIALRAAFTKHHALQCGYCTPGMLATAYDIVTRLPSADAPRVREELAGNLCRCTGYVGIVDAILDVLAQGPHERHLAARRADAIVIGAADAVTRAATAMPAPAPSPQGQMDVSSVAGATVIERAVAVACPVDRLWATLEDVRRVASCLPGAEVESVEEDGVVHGAFAVALGPIRATFRGRAKVAFDAAARRGTIRGEGGDARSRSAANGEIAFEAIANDASSSRLHLRIGYRLTGPIAQFGRPRIVSALVDEILAGFSRSLVAASEGKPSTPAPASAFSFLLIGIRALFGASRKPT